MEVISNDPLIRVYDDVITNEECEFIINVSKDNMVRAGVSSDTLDLNTYNGRTNKSYWIDLDKYDILKNLAIKISKIIGLPNYKKFESFQIIHYTKGQEYKYHYDAYDINNKKEYKKYCKDRGNRIMTVLCYLNTVYKGGGTGFDNLNNIDELIIDAKKGRMVVFQNVHMDGTFHVKSRHAGLPVEEGEKWAFNLWVREKI